MTVGNPFHWTQPATWPWVFYVWLVMVLAAYSSRAWRWIQRRRAASWPVTSGRIEFNAVSEPEPAPFAAERHYPFAALLLYSYSISGNGYGGRFEQGFSSEREADEFIRDLKDKTVAVSYDPDNPASSFLSDTAVDALLQNRGPRLFAESSPSVFDIWIKAILWVFSGIAALGILMSLRIHIAALMGQRIAPDENLFILQVGTVIVGLPTAFVARPLVGGTSRQSFWKAVLRDFAWMRFLIYGLTAYAVVQFVLLMSQASGRNIGGRPPAVVWQAYSAHWMLFYSAALAILYSAATKASPSTSRP